MFVLSWKFGTVVACQAVANIVKSSLGPVGLDKVSSAAMRGFYSLLAFVFSLGAVGCG